MTKLHNKTNGPKAIPTTDRGVLILEPGESADLNVADHDLKAIKSTGMLDRDGSVPNMAELQKQIASSPIGSYATNAEEAAEAQGAKAGKAKAEDNG